MAKNSVMRVIRWPVLRMPKTSPMTRIPEYEIDQRALEILRYCKEDGTYLTRSYFASTLLEDAIKRGRIGAMIAASDRAARRCLQRLHRAGRIRPTTTRRGWLLR